MRRVSPLSTWKVPGQIKSGRAEPGRAETDVRFYPAIAPENRVLFRPNDWAEAHIGGQGREADRRRAGPVHLGQPAEPSSTRRRRSRASRNRARPGRDRGS
ncbi:hypothetical protein GCM10010413_25750 [Promicromonospora sukumoe]